jgi:iron complex transport system substrate-binding protein
MSAKQFDQTFLKFEMKKIISCCILVMVLLASCLSMAVVPVSAQDSVPSTEDEIEEVARAVLANEILLYLRAVYFDEEIGHLSLEELRESASYYPQYPRQITDSVDRTVTIYKPVERLVCTLSHHLEALRILDVSEDTIVGVPSDLNPVFFPEFVEKTDVGGEGGPWNPDVEMILAQEPEVVILPSCGGPYGYTADQETERLEAAGVTVLRFCFNQPETFSEELAKSGYIFEKEDKADEFIAWHEGILSSIEAKLSGVAKKKVYAEHWPYTISTADDDIIAAAGGEDIFAGIPEEADVETLINGNPDIVIRAVYMGETGYGLTPNPGVIGRLEGVRSEILTRATEHGWNKTAVDNESVYIISSELWTYLPASGCRPFVGQCYLAKWFHPDLFPELKPKDIHQTYLTEFQGLDIDLDEQGIFVYHPEEHPDGN